MEVRPAGSQAGKLLEWQRACRGLRQREALLHLSCEFMVSRVQNFSTDTAHFPQSLRFLISGTLLIPQFCCCCLVTKLCLTLCSPMDCSYHSSNLLRAELLYHTNKWVSVSSSVMSNSLRTHGSPPGSSVHGILHARILEWVAIPFSRGSSQPRDRTRVSCVAGRFFTDWATREAQQNILAFGLLWPSTG